MVDLARRRLLAGLAVAPFARQAAADAQYDPREAANAPRARTALVDLADPARARTIPLKLHIPARGTPAPTILVSHGLGGDREAMSWLCRHLVGRDLVVVALQHPGSDAAIWQGKPTADAARAFKAAATPRQLIERTRDVAVALDALARWREEPGHPLFGLADPGRVGIVGHSFGALTAQAVGGQRFPGGRSLADARIKAVVAFSPSPPARGTPAQAFGAVAIPWLCATGTADAAPPGLGAADPKARLAVYEALPPGAKYELVLDGAEHSAFADRSLPGESGRRNVNHHKALRAIAAGFLEAHLAGEPFARAWIDGPGPRAQLEPKDSWRRK